MPRPRASRRRFLWAAAGLLASAAAPPTPIAPVVRTSEPRQYFVPLADYHELPPECYADNLIRPREIIVHWDGNTRGRELWVVAVTYETLKLLGQSAHFAVDYKRVWQLLPMYRSRVQESHGARGFNWAAINVELAGIDFDQPDNAPPASQTDLAVRLVSQLMDYYGLAFEHVAGHFERDPRGDKKDPGPRFMQDFRQGLQTYRDSLTPARRLRIADLGLRIDPDA